jgi:ABC-type transport system substrate-binding protein
MYGALTEQGPVPNVEIHPLLAKSWEISNDGREYIFSLQEGVKFHHGKELDSGDVKYSIERIPDRRRPEVSNAERLGDIGGGKIDDDRLSSADCSIPRSHSPHQY